MEGKHWKSSNISGTVREQRDSKTQASDMEASSPKLTELCTLPTVQENRVSDSSLLSYSVSDLQNQMISYQLVGDLHWEEGGSKRMTLGLFIILNITFPITSSGTLISVSVMWR